MHANAIVTLIAVAGAAVGQQVLTVPAAFDSTDAPSRLWVAGFTTALRQQVVVDQSHLQAMAGRTITALLWRREAAAEAFPGGSAALTVQLAESALDPTHASPWFAANLGANAQTVFTGTVAIPTAAATGTTGLIWDAGSTVRVPFQSGFAYGGTHLVIDLAGNPVGGGVAWWPADAAWDPASGTVVSVGTSCSPFADAAGETASATERSLVPGASATFWCRGTEYGLAFLFLSVAAPQLPGLPLAALLPGAPPGCSVYLPLPAEVIVTVFADVPFPGEGGRARFDLPIPGEPWVLGATLGAQWLDLQQQFATSNALRCTISAAMPSLGMCTIQNAAGQQKGSIATHVAHVLRFEYQ